jgi:hypothetical protein
MIHGQFCMPLVVWIVMGLQIKPKKSTDLVSDWWPAAWDYSGYIGPAKWAMSLSKAKRSLVNTITPSPLAKTSRSTAIWLLQHVHRSNCTTTT